METSKLEDGACDEEEDVQRQRKRLRMVQGKECLNQSGILQVHPLKINLHVYDDDVSDPKSAKLITLKFEYMVKLNIVCAGIEVSDDSPNDDILCNLFPDDTGLELPHQVWDVFPYMSLAHSSVRYLYLSFIPSTFYNVSVHDILLNGDAVCQAHCWGCCNIQ